MAEILEEPGNDFKGDDDDGDDDDDDDDTKTENESNTSIVVKREDPREPVCILHPGESYDGPVDGVMPPTWNGDWLKVPSSSPTANLEPDGTPTWVWEFVGKLPDLGESVSSSPWRLPDMAIRALDHIPGRKNEPNWSSPGRHDDWATSQSMPICN